MHIWYQANKGVLSCLLWPLSVLFRLSVFIRKNLYRYGVLTTRRFPVPIVVVGNLTVGGTGKTPLLIALAEYFTSLSYHVGIVSRGYGGRQRSPHLVQATDDPLQVGDEALLLVRRTQCPVVVARNRAEAVECLLKNFSCALILSDDGLQHYGLHRDIEIVVVDGKRRFGNQACLPAGPLREPLSRLKTVDFVIVNGEKASSDQYSFTVHADQALQSVVGNRHLSIADCQGKKIYAVAGIGHPERFFATLEQLGLSVEEKVFPDHYAFLPEDIAFENAEIIIMTEKDAVKCQKFADDRHFYLPITVDCESRFLTELSAKLRSLL